MRVPELGAATGDDDVAEQRGRAAEAQRVPLDGRDDRLVVVQKAFDDLARLAEHLERVHAVAAAAEPLLDVGAGAERAARSGDHGGADVGIALDVAGELCELGVHDAGHRAVSFRAVERDQGHPVVALLDQHLLVVLLVQLPRLACHGRTPLAARARSYTAGSGAG